MSEVEDAIAYVEKEQDAARSFAIEAFEKAADAGFEASVEVDGKYYVSTEILSLLAQAGVTSALVFTLRGENVASNAVAKMSQFIDAVNRQAKGLPNADIRGLAKDLGY